MPWHLKYDDQVPRGTWNMMTKCHAALEIWWSSAARHLKYDNQVPWHLINTFQVPHGTWSSYFKCRAALGHHISSATALDEWCNITMYYILHSTHNIYSYTWVYLHTLYTFIYFHIVSYIHSYTFICKFNESLMTWLLQVDVDSLRKWSEMKKGIA